MLLDLRCQLGKGVPSLCLQCAQCYKDVATVPSLKVGLNVDLVKARGPNPSLRGEQRVSEGREALHKERKRKLVFYPLLDLLT